MAAAFGFDLQDYLYFGGYPEAAGLIGDEDRWRDYVLGAVVVPNIERDILPPEVDAQPEGAYANDRRSDVRVSCSGFHVAIEAKRNSHRDLWSAIRSQLIEQYAGDDPATGGYGIYLVFWFGTQFGGTPPPGGRGVPCPDALRAQLEALLTEDERRRISVRVIDVSAPPR